MNLTEGIKEVLINSSDMSNDAIIYRIQNLAILAIRETLTFDSQDLLDDFTIDFFTKDIGDFKNK